jgi:uncharacterized protein YrrD
MRITPGTKVLTRAGQEIGTAHRLIYNPKTEEVEQLLVRPVGLSTEHRIIPFDRIDQIRADHIRLKIGKLELESLPLSMPLFNSYYALTAMQAQQKMLLEETIADLALTERLQDCAAPVLIPVNSKTDHRSHFQKMG